MLLVNCTPHDINVVSPEGETFLVIEASGIVPRCSMTRQQVRRVSLGAAEVAVNRSVAGAVEDLPDAQPGKLFVVSRMVAAAAPARDDLVFPDELVRDGDGRIVGCTSFGCM